MYRKSVWRHTEARLHIGRSNPHLYPSLVRRGIKRVQVLSLRKSLRELVNGIPELESLNLSGCYNLSDSALDGAFNKDVPHLKRLDLSLCKEVSDNSLGRIAAHCKNLNDLNLGGCAKVTNTGLLLISWGLKKLKRLNLRSCRLVSDAGIGHLCGVDGHTHQSKTSSLVDIGLQDCQKLSDEALRHVAVGMPALERINLSFCVSVTDSGMKSLAQLRRLRDLNLRSCDNVSDIGIGFLAENGGSPLTALDVSFCTNVTDGAVKHIAGGFGGLATLSLTTCAIGDASLEKMAAALAKLEELNIGQCLSVTDKGLEHLGKKAKKLTSLDLYGCPKVTKASLEKLRSDLPQLKRINLEL